MDCVFEARSDPRYRAPVGQLHRSFLLENRRGPKGVLAVTPIQAFRIRIARGAR